MKSFTAPKEFDSFFDKNLQLHKIIGTETLKPVKITHA